MPEPYLTLNAQIRWLQHVENLDVESTRRSLKQSQSCRDHVSLQLAVRKKLLLETGRTEQEFVNSVLTEDRKAAIRAGVRAIKLPCGATMKINGGEVVTISPAGLYTKPDVKRRRKHRLRNQRRHDGVAS